MTELTHEKLLELLHYDPNTGIFTRNSGNVAGRKLFGKRKLNVPYWRINILGKDYQRSRLAWFYMTGQWPVFEMDHRDRDSLNDRWNNLREATRSQNEANRCERRNNKLGIKGVSLAGRKYQAQIYRGRKIYLGRFETPEEAYSAYLAEAKKHDGEFLALGALKK